MRLVLLDSGSLGQFVHPRGDPTFHAWADAVTSGDAQLVIPEICDYEVRRELIRTGLEFSIARLDRACQALWFEPISTPIIRRASLLWADARRRGRPTASDAALDGDVILAATAQLLMENGHEAIVATANLNHLTRLVPAARWDDIDP